MLLVCGTGERNKKAAVWIIVAPYEQLDPQKSEVVCSYEYCASTKEPLTESRFFLPMQIGTLSYSALVDSGSMHTYMGEKTIFSMPVGEQDQIPSVAKLADGSRATIQEKVLSDIRIGSIVRA